MINHSTTDVKRHYDAARRREQPRQNHRRIIDTAERIFLSNGYSATTVQAIAAGAGVSADTSLSAHHWRSRLAASHEALVARHRVRMEVRGLPCLG